MSQYSSVTLKMKVPLKEIVEQSFIELAINGYNPPVEIYVNVPTELYDEAISLKDIQYKIDCGGIGALPIKVIGGYRKCWRVAFVNEKDEVYFEVNGFFHD